MTAQNSTGFDRSVRSANKIRLGTCGDLADKWNVHNARLTRTALFLFVATLGYMYYTSPDTPPPSRTLRKEGAQKQFRNSSKSLPNNHPDILSTDRFLLPQN